MMDVQLDEELDEMRFYCGSGISGDDEVTVYDSSGLLLQDLYIGRALLAKHRS